MATRTSDGIARALAERQEAQERERRRTLGALLRELRHARESRAEWYTWVVAGMPHVTQAEYDAIKEKRRKRRTSE